MATNKLRAVNDTKSAVTLEQLLGNERPLSINVGQGSFTITYNPAAVTTRLVNVDSKDRDEIARALCSVVRSWPLADYNGEIPVGPEHVAEVATRVPTAVCVAVLRQVQEDQSVDPTTTTTPS